MITVLFALLSLLFMQLAVAGYACPGDVQGGRLAMAGMPCAGDMVGMDAEQPALCQAHCQSVEQTSEKIQTAAPVDMVQGGFFYVVEPARLSTPSHPAQAPSLLRSTAPPVAVLNCCFRI